MCSKKYGAFTLIELLVVIAIIVLLVSILIPSLNKAKEMARQMLCMTNLKNIGTGFQIYNSEYGTVPPYQMSDAFSPEPYAIWSWQLVTAKVLDGQTYPNNDGARGDMFVCPSKDEITEDFRSGGGWYGDYGPNGFIFKLPSGVAPDDWAFPLTQIKSPGSTYFVGENQMRYANTGWMGTGWLPGRPYIQAGYLGETDDTHIDTYYLSYQYDAHGETTNMLFTDGHVENVEGMTPHEKFVYAKRPWYND